jgi:hypothetical protein
MRSSMRQTQRRFQQAFCLRTTMEYVPMECIEEAEVADMMEEWLGMGGKAASIVFMTMPREAAVVVAVVEVVLPRNRNNGNSSSSSSSSLDGSKMRQNSSSFGTMMTT